MNSEHKCWIISFIIGAITVVLLTVGGFGYWLAKANVISNMVHNGADPIRAACSLEVGNSTIRDCIVEMSKK